MIQIISPHTVQENKLLRLPRLRLRPSRLTITRCTASKHGWKKCVSVFVCLNQTITYFKLEGSKLNVSFFFFTCCGRTLQRNVSFEPLGLFDKTPGVCRFARLRPQMFALSFSAAPQTNTSVSSSAKVYGPCRTWRKVGSRSAGCAVDTSAAYFFLDIPSFPALSSAAFVILTLKGFMGRGGVLIQAGVGSKLLLCSPLPAIFLSVLGKAITHLSLLTIFFFSFYSRLKITDKRVNVCVGERVLVCVGRGVDDSSFDPGALVVKSCRDWRDCWPQLTVTIRARSRSPSGALKG